jgi:hypothetical protein
MSTAHFTFPRLAASLLLLLPAFARADDARLKPFKDDLFSAQTVLESRDGGAFQILDYQEMRDINGRDEIPERRVKSAYVSLGVKRAQVDETLQLADGRSLDVTRVGPSANAAFTVIFIHGRGGDRRLGVNDYTFGGNFNRLKNLAAGNFGSYYSPSVHTFDSAGVAAVAGLIAHAAAQSPGKPIILSCASMGSFICWGIARDKPSVAHLTGMAILGGATDPQFVGSAGYKKKLPIFFTHGGDDPVYAAADQIGLYGKLRKAKYPVRFTLFQSGSHGTPVRMTDWRAVLNWLMTAG